MPDYLTASEVADELDYHVESVRRIIRTGKLQADKKAGVWLVPREALQDYRQRIEGKSKHDPRLGS
jgi:hypothetical protein